MNTENSGKLYILPLDYEFGYVYAELLDYSDTQSFDGILVRIYALDCDASKKVGEYPIEDIVSSNVIFGPVPINKYPNVKGKNAWKYIGKNVNYTRNSLFFKRLRGLLFKSKNWEDLETWFKFEWDNDDFEAIQCTYDEVRNLETTILNHLDGIKVMVTMMKIIEKGEKVKDYYNLLELGMINLYIRLVNTYYSKEESKELLKEVKFP